jgi:hypothetical protein
MSDDTTNTAPEPAERDRDDEPDRRDAGDATGRELRVDPEAPGRSLFEDGDAVEPNEPA